MKTNSKYIIDLNVRGKDVTIRLNFCDPEFGHVLLEMTLKAQATKEKNKSNFIKIKNFYASGKG